MKKTLKAIAFLLAILAVINGNAQHIIRYEMDNNNAENLKVLFVDTLNNEVKDSFYLHERNPYWNLPYDTIETGNYSVKTYKFNNIDSLTIDEIPGLIAYGPGNVSRYPGWADASHGAFLSTNGQFIVTINRLILYVYSENDFVDHASKVVTYMADGKIYNSYYPEDMYVDYVDITDDGNYYLLRGWAQSVNALDGILNIWKIIDIRSNQEVLAEISSNDSLRGLYGLVYGNYILFMQGSVNERDKFGPIIGGYMRCFDVANNLVFSTQVDPKSTSFSMFKRITSEGVHFKSLQGKNEPDQVLRFDRDFTKQPIR
jgi:hypothetical protein